jgi:hypothetical protein
MSASNMIVSRALDTHAQPAPNRRRFPSVYAGTTVALNKTLDFHHSRMLTDIRDRDSSPRDRASAELDYYVNTAAIVFDYYEMCSPSGGGGSPTARDAPVSSSGGGASLSHPHGDKPRSIMRYFLRDDTAQTAEPPTKVMFRQEDRAALLEKYMCRTVPSHMKNAALLKSAATSKMDDVYNACEFCGSMSRTALPHDGMITCDECGSVEYVLVDHERPSYKEPPKEISYFAYKRINHLNEWLNQVQGKETTDIPDDVYDKIFVEIKKRKITNMADIDHAQLKNIMRKLHINKYYEHLPHILYRLNGVPVPVLSPELEDRLRGMFKQIQAPFLKHSPSTRKNFLSYSYCLHKCLQLLDKDEYLQCFPLLKSREKLQTQDNIWKKICEDLNWQFIKSL